MDKKLNDVLFKWCNCYRNGRDIYVQCYDSDFEAVHQFEKLEKKNDEKPKKEQNECLFIYDESRLVKLSRIMPDWVNAYTVRRAFRPTVNFIPTWWHTRSDTETEADKQ